MMYYRMRNYSESSGALHSYPDDFKGRVSDAEAEILYNYGPGD